MSPARRRGLLRLAVLLLLIAGAVALIVRPGGNSGAGSQAQRSAPSAPRPSSAAAKQRLGASVLPERLPSPLSGEALAPGADGVLVIGGVDAADASTDSVLRLDPAGRRVTRYGTLAQPLHDAAAAALPGQTLVFGGGAGSTFGTVQVLNPGSTALALGRLPTAASDLSALPLAGSAFVLGGYDGRTTVGSVVKSADGRRFDRVAELPTAVRYTAVAALGNTIYAFGGELASGQDTNEIQAVDTTSGGARVIGHLSETLAHASAVAIGGTIYLLGGRSNGSTSGRILRFDPQSQTAGNAGHLPMPVTNAAAAVLGDTGYLVGGLDSAGASLDTIIAVH